MKKTYWIEIIILVIFLLPLNFCASGRTTSEVPLREGVIQTTWNFPANAKIRLYSTSNEKFSTFVIPCDIKMEAQGEEYRYYVEIMTTEQNRIYGVLEALNTSELTDLTKIKIEITSEILNKVMNNQVSQISVTDPANQIKILVLTLGNRMPPEMIEIYKDEKITPY